MRHFFNKIQTDTSAVAMIEGLLICVPIWIFLALLLHILSYWETKQLDPVMKYGTAMAERLISTNKTHLELGSSSNKYSPPPSTTPQFYMEKITGSAELPMYYYYITDYISAHKIRKFSGMRRYNTWISHPLLKGQNPKDEGIDVQKWYDKMGNKELNNSRKALQLGS